MKSMCVDNHRTRERAYGLSLSSSQAEAKPRNTQILKNVVCEIKSKGTAHISLLYMSMQIC